MSHKKMNIDAGKSISDVKIDWASSISDYIIKRRQQTYSAYHNQSDSPQSQTSTHPDVSLPNVKRTHEKNKINKSAIESQNYHNVVFKALLIILASQFENGHTVLRLTADNSKLTNKQYNKQTNQDCNATENRVGQSSSADTINLNYLSSWQQTVIDILLEPATALLDALAHEMSENDKTEERHSDLTKVSVLEYALNNRSKINLLTASTNTNVDQLMERLELAYELYQYIKDMDLHNFVNVINRNPLFHNVDSNENSLSKINRPIIYKSSESIENNPHTPSHTTVTFWLHRTWQAELNLATNIQRILNQNIKPLSIVIPPSLNQQQITAINIANNNAFSIITGGPGTGKTFTVAQLVIALQGNDTSLEQSININTVDNNRGANLAIDSASLALVAPTGKAAQRMQESLQVALNNANVSIELQEAKTIHRLLGIGQGGRPRYDATNPLGEDVIIVDEASMLGVELANYLVSAIKPGARLILLGDANQLAAVDAGAVLADLCRINALKSVHIELVESRRFSEESGIGRLAALINSSESSLKDIWDVINNDAKLEYAMVNNNAIIKDNKIENSLSKEYSSKKNYFKSNQIKEKPPISYRSLSKNYNQYLEKISILMHDPIANLSAEAIINTIKELMGVFNQYRILTAGHHGKWGDNVINQFMTQWHKTQLKLPIGKSPWYHGRPIMILQNNYELGLFNGDIGFCLSKEGGVGRFEVYFENNPRGIAVNLLNEELVSTAYAMTIHKSQGSEFDHVAVCFDDTNSRLLSKELLYTAVTRAKDHVSLFSTPTAIEKALYTPTVRQTGLALQFESGMQL